MPILDIPQKSNTSKKVKSEIIGYIKILMETAASNPKNSRRPWYGDGTEKEIVRRFAFSQKKIDWSIKFLEYSPVVFDAESKINSNLKKTKQR